MKGEGKMKNNEEANKVNILPLSNDYVFKRIFGKGGNERILKSLLEAILEIKIQKIEIKNSEIPKESIKEKLSILDIKAVINENIILDIENKPYTLWENIGPGKN